MAFLIRSITILALLGALNGPLSAQEAKIAFDGLAQDTSLPVEVQADTLSVNNANGTAVFEGNVLVTVEYGADAKTIARLNATGGVTIANLTDAAEAREALYTIDSGVIVMTGDVLLTQGASALAGQKLTINLKDGTGVMEGRVSTVFVPGGN
jgi:lipopolysaccharide export system protein LptA